MQNQSYRIATSHVCHDSLWEEQQKMMQCDDVMHNEPMSPLIASATAFRLAAIGQTLKKLAVENVITMINGTGILEYTYRT